MSNPFYHYAPPPPHKLPPAPPPQIARPNAQATSVASGGRPDVGQQIAASSGAILSHPQFHESLDSATALAAQGVEPVYVYRSANGQPISVTKDYPGPIEHVEVKPSGAVVYHVPGGSAVPLRERSWQ